MSFFDEGDEPTRVTRPRRPAPRTGGTAVDPQTLMIRRAAALGAGLLVIVLLVLGIRGCLDSQKKQGLKDYNRDVTALVQASDAEVSKPFFQQLTGGNADALDLETNINQLAATADGIVKRARGLDVPDDMKRAQSGLLLTLELRRDALRKIASKLRTALSSGSGAEQAVKEITGQMSAFLASDVVYSQRVFPAISSALADNDVGDQEIATSQFLPSVSWLDEAQVADRLGASVTPTGGSTGAVAPGLHGHGLTSVSVGNITLQPGAANRIPAGSDVTFTVKFQNQGENDERNVGLKLTISRQGGGRAQTVTSKVATTTAGAEATGEITLRNAPPIGTPVEITIEVSPVRGEKKTDNNKQTYPALFTP